MLARNNMFNYHKHEHINNNTTHKAADNLFTVLNSELERLHKLLELSLKHIKNEDNIQSIYKRIKELQQVLIEAAEKNSTECIQKELASLKSDVADLALLGNNESAQSKD